MLIKKEGEIVLYVCSLVIGNKFLLITINWIEQ